MPNEADNEPNPPPLPRCSGDSKCDATYHGRTDCEYCDGLGVHQDMPSWGVLVDAKCDHCNGTGEVARTDCECDGYPGAMCGCGQRKDQQ